MKEDMLRDKNGNVDLTVPLKSEVLAQEKERKKQKESIIPRKFPSTDMVYHFHPIAFVNHMKKIFGGGSSGVCYAELRVRAFMRMIRKCEGTAQESGYSRLFGKNNYFTKPPYNKNMFTHPDELAKEGGYKSRAAGAYQILKSTFDGLQIKAKEYGISGFDEKAQDELCLLILKYNYRKERSKKFFHTEAGVEIESRKKFIGVKADVIQKIIDNDINYALFVSCLCWASLPNAPYGQPVKTLAQVKKLYSDYLIEEINGNTTLHLEPGFLNKFGYNCYNDSKSVMPPWMEIALSRAIMVQGVDEGQEPLFSFAKGCLELGGSKARPDDNKYGQWCGAFVGWCLNEANYKIGTQKWEILSSQRYIKLANDGKFYKKIDEPVLGCIVVMTNYKKTDGTSKGSGHITYLYGVNGNNLVCLGGNQNSCLKFSNYKRTGVSYDGGSYEQKFNCFLMPINYPESHYNCDIPVITADKANKELGINLKTSDNEPTQ